MTTRFKRTAENAENERRVEEFAAIVRTRSDEEIAQADKDALEFEKDLPCYYDDGIIPVESEGEDITHSRSEGWGFYGYFRPHKPRPSPAPATPVTGRRKRSGAPKRRRRA